MELGNEQWHYTVVTGDSKLDCYCIHRKGKDGSARFPDPIADVYAEEKYAVLITAAPKMLEALEIASLILDGNKRNHDWDGKREEAVNLINAAIAEATDSAT